MQKRILIAVASLLFVCGGSHAEDTNNQKPLRLGRYDALIIRSSTSTGTPAQTRISFQCFWFGWETFSVGVPNKGSEVAYFCDPQKGGQAQLIDVKRAEEELNPILILIDSLDGAEEVAATNK